MKLSLVSGARSFIFMLYCFFMYQLFIFWKVLLSMIFKSNSQRIFIKYYIERNGNYPEIIEPDFLSSSKFLKFWHFSSFKRHRIINFYKLYIIFLQLSIRTKESISESESSKLFPTDIFHFFEKSKFHQLRNICIVMLRNGQYYCIL